MSNNKQNRNELIINAFLDECISFDEPNNMRSIMLMPASNIPSIYFFVFSVQHTKTLNKDG